MTALFFSPAASAKHYANTQSKVKVKHMAMAPIQSPIAVNHLFIGRKGVVNNRKNKTIAEAPSIAPLYNHPHIISAQQNLKNMARSPNKAKSPNSARQRNLSCESTDSAASKVSSSSSFQTNSTRIPSIGSGSDASTYEAESDYTHGDSDTDIASIVDAHDPEGEFQHPDLISPDSLLEGPSEECVTSNVVIRTENVDAENEECSADSAAENESAPYEANNNSLRKSPVKKPDQLPLDTTNSADSTPKALTPTKTVNSIQAEIDMKKSPTSDRGTDEYIAHLTYKAHKHTLCDQLSPPSPPSSDPDSPNSQRANKVFNPFPSHMMSRRRAQNGIKLGLYSADAVEGKGDAKNSKNIGRQQINSCLHRQYMAEVKQSAKSNKKPWK